MSKQQKTKKLVVKKDTLKELTDAQLEGAAGGGWCRCSGDTGCYK